MARQGRKLRQFLRNVKHKRGVNQVEVGFYSTARYPDGTPVTNVAAWNEFGTETIPERPFMRLAIKGAEDELLPILQDGVNPRTMVVDEHTGGRLGLAMQARIQRSITRLREPPNAPATIERKGSSNPLIDEGFMRRSTTYRVVK